MKAIFLAEDSSFLIRAIIELQLLGCEVVGSKPCIFTNPCYVLEVDRRQIRIIKYSYDVTKEKFLFPLRDHNYTMIMNNFVNWFLMF